jgi:hypothetical protein
MVSDVLDSDPGGDPPPILVLIIHPEIQNSELYFTVYP